MALSISSLRVEKNLSTNVNIDYTEKEYAHLSNTTTMIHYSISRNLAKLEYLGSHPTLLQVFELFNRLPKGSLVPEHHPIKFTV